MSSAFMKICFTFAGDSLLGRLWHSTSRENSPLAVFVWSSTSNHKGEYDCMRSIWVHMVIHVALNWFELYIFNNQYMFVMVPDSIECTFLQWHVMTHYCSTICKYNIVVRYTVAFDGVWWSNMLHDRLYLSVQVKNSIELASIDKYLYLYM